MNLPFRAARMSAPAAPPRGCPVEEMEVEEGEEEEEEEEEEEAGSDVNLHGMSMWPVFLWLDGLALSPEF